MSSNVTPGRPSTAPSTSRGTAMSTISSGRPAVARSDDSISVTTTSRRRST